MDRTRIMLIVLVVIVLGGGAYYQFVYSKAGSEGETTPPAAQPDCANPPVPGTPEGDAAAAYCAGQPPASPTDPTATTPVDPTATTPTTATPPPGAPAPGAPTGAAPTATANPRLVVEDPVSGNNAYSLTLGKLVVSLGAKNTLNFKVDTQLVPARGGLTYNKPKLRIYRPLVKGAIMRVTIADDATFQQWSTSSKAIRKDAVKGYLNLLGKLMPNAFRSVTIVGTSNTVLAQGDAVPGSKTATILVYG